MRQLIAFAGKEFMELIRTGKLIILTLLFLFFGIMNPAIAKMTPWLMEMMSESLGEAGLTVTEVEVDAMTSWMQFYKNIPIALILFLLLFSSILTVEYQKGTLINMITKGMARWGIIASKAVVMLVLWTAEYWMCYGITYAYNAYFWDNSIASHVFFPAVCFYLIGIWLISLILLMSVLFQSSSAVVAASGIVFLLIYLLGLFPDIKEYLPAQLLNSSGLLAGMEELSEYLYAVVVTIVLSVMNLVAAVIGFNKRNIS